MSKAGDCFVRCCTRLNRLPSIVLCFFIIVAQDITVDYYLVHHLAMTHIFWAAPDLVVLILVFVCFRMTSHSDLEHDDDAATEATTNGKHTEHMDDPDHSQTQTQTNNSSSSSSSSSSYSYVLVWVTWTAMQIVLGAKLVIVCASFATDLDENDFFGPNTLKTAVALGSCVYVLLLASQHDASPSSDRRRYIEELTGTVVFDLLDTADILDVLFDSEDRPGLSSGIPEVIMFVAVANLLLPTVPLITLSKTKFGLQKLSKRLVYIHRLGLVLAVNVPNLAIRVAIWHGHSVGVSPFTLKNVIIICMTAYEFYEHKREKYEMHEEEEKEGKEREGREENGIGGDHNGNGNAKSMETKMRERDEMIINDENEGGKKRHWNSSSNHRDGIHFDIENRMVTDM